MESRAPEAPGLADAESAGRPQRQDREQAQLEGQTAPQPQPRRPDDPLRFESQFAQATQIPTATPAAIPAPAAIGKVDKVSGSATATRNGMPVELHLGDPIYKGDVLETASDSTLSVRFSDGTVFGLSASARIVVNDMFYAAGGTSGSNALFSILKGAIGLVAGRAAKTGEFSVETPVATMGIRGTAVKIEVAANGATKFSVMREPNGAVGRLVIFDKADHSHILATLQDVRTAVLFPGVGAADSSPIRIAKTNDELRSEGALVRDLYQSLRDLFPRRGSADPDFGFVVPVLDTGPFAPDLPRSAAIGPAVAFGTTLTPVGIATPSLSSEPRIISAQAIAFEDGPLVDLGDATTKSFLITPPAVLPAGVSFDARTGRFELNPADLAFQSLGAGQTATIVVHYTAFDGVSTFPATVTWIVEGRNDAPVTTPDRIAGLAHTGATVLDVTANDSDVDHDALTISQYTQPTEGRVFVDAGGHLVFDPGTAFAALGAGRTATVSFSYTISDGHGGTASEITTLTVQGEGTFVSAPVAATRTGVLPASGQTVQVSLTAPAQTVETAAKLDLAVTLGALPHRPLNILYLIDVSGSTSNHFDGAAVGDRNGDGTADTILDAEIASLSNLTDRVRALGFSPDDVSVTIVPFNGTAGTPQTFSLGAAGDAGIAQALASLVSSDGTNFEAALQAAVGRLETLDPGHNEQNVLYFLSDGNADNNISDELATLNNVFHTTIAAAGVGSPVRLDVLSAIDNTGGAITLAGPGGLEIGPVGQPLRSGEVLDVDVVVNGVHLADVGLDDLVRSGDSYRLIVPAEDLHRFAGDHNSVVATVTLTGGVTLTASLDVQGALPRSTDFDF